MKHAKKSKPQLKKFCICCGALMSAKRVSITYDLDDGHQRYGLHWTCPQRKGKMFSWHTQYDTDEQGHSLMSFR